MIQILLAGILWVSTILPGYAQQPEGEEVPAEEISEPEQPEVPEEEEEPETEEAELIEEADPESDPSEAEEEQEPEAEIDGPQTPAEPESAAYSCRLIVITDSEIRAEDIILSRYENMYILGYEDEESLKQALEYYSEHAEHAERDAVFQIADEETEEEPENSDPFQQLSELMEEPSVVLMEKEPVIALIDTGADPDCRAVISAVSVLGENPQDDNGHGTKMAELILAENPDARILSIKAMDQGGSGTVSSVFAAIEYAVAQKADIISLSASAVRSEKSTVILDAISRAVKNGIPVVGAAGNRGMNASYFLPSCSEAALIIGSCGPDGAIRTISNFGSTVDYLVTSGTTSEAAARFSGILSKHIASDPIRFTEKNLFRYEWDGKSHGKGVPIGEDDDFHIQCNGFRYGDVYFWQIPHGATTTADAILIPNVQQDILNAKTDTKNGYDVLFQQYADEIFTPGHGYSIFASTHKPNTVSSWGSSAEEDGDTGRYFNSSREYTLNAKTLSGFTYRGMIAQQAVNHHDGDYGPGSHNVPIVFPGPVPLTSLSNAVSVNLKLGEEGAVKWNSKGWEETSGGVDYEGFRVDFYYEAPDQNYNLTINYLEEGTDKVLSPKYGPKVFAAGAQYEVASPDISGYVLCDSAQKTVKGTMPAKDHTINVYYRKQFRIDTRVINGKITLNNDMEQSGAVGDNTWNASGAVTGISSGQKRTIRYEPRPDYVMDYVKVDGTNTDFSNCLSSYSFNGINADHKIEVRYSPKPPAEKTVKNDAGTVIDGNMVRAGDILTYEIKVKNTFSETKKFTIRDSIPSLAEYVAGSASDGGNNAGGVLTWSLDVASGKEKTVTFRVKVKNEAKGKIVKNTAEAEVNQVRITTNPTENPVLPDPVKKITDPSGTDLNGRTVSKETVLRYQITVKNPASAAKVFTIRDTIQPYQKLRQNSISDGGSLSGSQITWQVTVAAGGEKTVTFETNADEWGKKIPNRASVTVDHGPTAETNETVVYTPVPPEKTVRSVGGVDLNGRAIAVNETFFYEIAVKNPTETTRLFTVSDDVPSVLKVLDAGELKETYVSKGAGASWNGNHVTWKMNLAAGEEKKLYIRAILTESDVTFTNRATEIVDQAEIESNEVKNWSARIIINALIRQYYGPYGQPAFLYSIADSTGTTWHRMIIVDPSSRTGQAVLDIPTGHDADQWVIRDEKGTRYQFVSAESGSANMNVSGNTGKADISADARLGIIDYVYDIVRWDETSHLAAVTNPITCRKG